MVATMEAGIRGPADTVTSAGDSMNLKSVTWALALSASFLYLLCIAHGLANPGATQMRDFLRLVLPGFHWLTPEGFVTGLVKSFLYGALLGLVYVPIKNGLDAFFSR